MHKALPRRLALTGAGILSLGIPATARADFKSALAARLLADPSLIVVNLPPRPDVWPGAIFTGNMRIPIRRGDASDGAIRRGSPININATQNFDAGANARGGFSSWLGLSASAADAATMLMTLPDVSVLDMDFNSIIQRIQETQPVVDAGRRGRAPVVVTKAYEATPTITLFRKAQGNAEAWATLRREMQAEGRAHVASDNAIQYSASSPIIIAFETHQIEFDLDELNRGRVRPRLVSLPQNLFALREEEADQGLAAVTGISVDAIRNDVILGGRNSFFRSLMGTRF